MSSFDNGYTNYASDATATTTMYSTSNFITFDFIDSLRCLPKRVFKNDEDHKLDRWNKRYAVTRIVKSLSDCVGLSMVRKLGTNGEKIDGGLVGRGTRGGTEKTFLLAIGKWRVERNGLSPGQRSFQKRKSFTQSLVRGNI